MIIPQIDQDLATVKAIHIQFYNGYHLSKKDYEQYIQAMNRLNDISNSILRDYLKEQTK